MTGADSLLRAARREAAVRLRRTTASACGRCRAPAAEVVAHADLLAVADDRRAGQGEHQAVRQLQAAPVAAQHRREAAADAAVVQLHARVGPERREDRRAAPRRSAGRGRSRRGCAGSSPTGPSAGAAAVASGPRSAASASSRGQGQEQVLVDPEVEQHVHAVAVAEDVEHLVRLRRWPRPASSRRRARHDRNWRKSRQVVVVLRARRPRSALHLDQERRRVHPEAGHAQLEPEAHDLAGSPRAPPGWRCSGRAGSRRSGGSSRPCACLS